MFLRHNQSWSFPVAEWRGCPCLLSGTNPNPEHREAEPIVALGARLPFFRGQRGNLTLHGEQARDHRVDATVAKWNLPDHRKRREELFAEPLEGLMPLTFGLGDPALSSGKMREVGYFPRG